MSLNCLVALSDGRFWLILGNEPMTQISLRVTLKTDDRGKQGLIPPLVH